MQHTAGANKLWRNMDLCIVHIPALFKKVLTWFSFLKLRFLPLKDASTMILHTAGAGGVGMWGREDNS